MQIPQCRHPLNTDSMITTQHQNPATNTGIEAIAEWCTPDGLWVYQGSPQTVLSLDVKAAFDPNPVGHGGVAKVVFSIVVNGGAPTLRTVNSRSIRQPNYDNYTSPLPGATPGLPAKINAYGFDLDLSTLAGGTVVVTPTVHAVSGKTTVMSALTIYNDTDGMDRRPAPYARYVDPVNGTDLGSGSLGNPVKTITQALIAGLPNSSGTSASNRDVGGLIIYVLGDITGMGGGTTPTWHTSGSRWLRIESTGGRHTYRRTVNGSYTGPQDSLYGAGHLGLPARVEFVGFHVEGQGFVVEKLPGCTVSAREINVTSASKFYSSLSGKPNVNWTFDNGNILSITDTGGSKEAWGVYRTGASYGYAGYKIVHDFRLRQILGVNLQNTGGTYMFSAGLIDGIRYKPGEIEGYCDTSYNFVVRGGVHLTVTKPSATVMRIAANDSTPPDFAEQLSHIAGAKGILWGIKLSGFTSGANNVYKAVDATGYTGAGWPYVEITNASGVAEVGGASARIETAKISTGEAYSGAIHPDVWQAIAPTDGAIISEVRTMDCQNTRSFVSSGQAVNRLWMDNVADGSMPSGSGTLEFDMAGCVNFTNSIIQNCSFSSPAISWGTGTVYTGTSLIDNVWGFAHATDFPSGYNRGNHFVTGTAHGIEATSGSFFSQADPSVYPFSLVPLVAVQRRGTGFLQIDPRWQLDGGRPTIADWVLR